MRCLSTNDDYLVNCDMYQGKIPNYNESCEILFGKCAAGFVSMLDELCRVPVQIYEYQFIELHYSTLRGNRIPKNCTRKNIKKEERGTYSSAIDTNHAVIFVRWTDNKVVTEASTFFFEMYKDTINLKNKKKCKCKDVVGRIYSDSIIRIWVVVN